MRVVGAWPYPRGQVRGEAQPLSVLTDADVVAIRERYAAGGVTQKALAEEYGVTQTTVNKVVLRKTWKHV